MKFDVFKWAEVRVGEKFAVPQGRVHVMCSAPCNLYVESFGYEVLAGFGQKIDIQTASPVTATVEGPKGARVFLYRPEAPSFKPSGEVFTNPDRMPLESGTVLEIKKELRKFKLAQAELRREMAIAAQHSRAKREQPAEPEPAQPTVQPGQQADSTVEGAATDV